VKNLIGKKFGKLLVIKKMNNNKYRQHMWLCLCECGKEKIVRGNNLKSRVTKSCGCSRTKHGHTKMVVSKTYTAWKNMVRRCTSPNEKNYRYYGGRGIKVCKRWQKFMNFLEDMGEPPTQKHSIDRIDNDGNYCKANCRWVTSKINNRNRRNNHLISHGGKIQCVSAWAEELKINITTLRARLYLDWSVEKALTTPVRKKNE